MVLLTSDAILVMDGISINCVLSIKVCINRLMSLHIQRSNGKLGQSIYHNGLCDLDCFSRNEMYVYLIFVTNYYKEKYLLQRNFSQQQ